MGTNLLSWSFDGVTVISIVTVPGSTTLPAIRVVSGVEFTVLDTQMYTVSQISFVASVMMSGGSQGIRVVTNFQRLNPISFLDSR